MNSSKFFALDCGPLRFEWHYAADRWRHEIGFLIDGQFVAVAKSLEGTGDDDWPPSPALQEMHVESRGNQTAVLLMGMGGAGHWSASVLGDPVSERATFEIACRCRAEPAILGSLYQIAEGSQVLHSNRRVKLALPGSKFSAIAETESGVHCLPQQVHFLPEPTPQRCPKTICWTYSFSVSPLTSPQSTP